MTKKHVIYLNEEQFNWFLERLEEDAKELPKLKELLQKPTVFDFQEEDKG